MIDPAKCSACCFCWDCVGDEPYCLIEKDASECEGPGEEEEDE